MNVSYLHFSSHLPTSLISLHLVNSPHFENTLYTVAAKEKLSKLDKMGRYWHTSRM